MNGKKFGAENKARKVITYAASFGNTTLEKLKDYGVDKEVATYLCNIDPISVRDANSGKMVMGLTGRVPADKFMILYDYKSHI